MKISRRIIIIIRIRAELRDKKIRKIYINQ
jgi:hypothetical protein